MDESEVPEVAEHEPPSAWLWHVYLFTQPRTFFRHFAVTPVPVLTAGCAWLFGMSSAIHRIEKSVHRGKSVPGVETWDAYLLLLLVVGAVGGLWYSAIGGWWYRMRLKWAGAYAPDPGLAKRVYLFSAQIYALPMVAVTVFESSFYATPRDAILSDRGWLYLVLLVFPFWSVLASYVGIRSVFQGLRRGSTLAWFLILPTTVYGLAVAGTLAARPALHAPSLSELAIYRGTTMEFSYPGNWLLDLEESEDDVESVRLESLAGVLLRIATVSSADTPAEEMEYLLRGYGNLEGWSLGQTFGSWGSHRGLGATGTFVVDGTSYSVRLFVAQREGSGFVRVQATFLESEASRILPALQVIGAAFELK